MKRIILLALLVVAGTMIIWSQVPQAMNYKAIAKDDWGVSLPNKTITLRFTILQDSETGLIVYQETHRTTTNKFGLMDVEIGKGTPVMFSFDMIDWSTGVYYIKIEMDPNGGKNFRLEDQAHQLLSVPYALFAESSGNTNFIETDPLFTSSPSYGIWSTDISNWNTAFNWGNHATEGYLKSFTETDPIFLVHPSHGIASDNINNWNAAYGWGNHAGLYKPVDYFPEWEEITNKPTFATVATSGSYNDLINSPALFSGAWADITGKPTTLAGYGITDADNSTTNEIQLLSLSGTLLTLSNGGGTVTLPSSGGDNWGNQTVVTDATLTGNGTVVTPLKIADNGVISAKIASDAVTEDKLAESSVTTDKISTGAVTGPKIAQSGATTGQVLKWNNTTWSPANDETGGGGGGWTDDGTIVRLSTMTDRVGIGTLTPTDRLNVVQEDATVGLSAIRGTATATQGRGVIGEATNTASIGVQGIATNTGSTGVWGEGSNVGVYGRSGLLNTGKAVFGQATESTTYSGYFDGGRFYVSGRVGIGTFPTYVYGKRDFKLNVYGNAQVKDTLFASAVKITNSPRVFFKNSNPGSPKNISTMGSWGPLDSIVVEAPGPGSVLLNVTGFLQSSHSYLGNTWVYVGISESRRSRNLEDALSKTAWLMDERLEGGFYQVPCAVTAVAVVPAFWEVGMGTHTYYIVGWFQEWDGEEDEVAFGSGAISALFIPNP